MSLLQRLYRTAAPSPRAAREAATTATRWADYQTAVARVALAQARPRARGRLVRRVPAERVERVADALHLPDAAWRWLYGAWAA